MPADITSAITTWRQVQHLLPADINAAIKQRAVTWQKRPVTTQAAQVAAAPPALLVMRPGTIPRPIDPFFFEIINH